jgi:Zn-dependent M28 family amino/carboxypeptidase
MAGRATATPGAARAATWIAERLRQYGVTPGGDEGYFQRVRFYEEDRPDGRVLRLQLPDLPDSLRRGKPVSDVNVIGFVRGADSTLRQEAVVIGAHYDHVGIGEPVNGDSIYNGADDDASGVVAVLLAARDLAKGPRPRRTVIFILSTGEEQGILGTLWYVHHPLVPLSNTIADLQVEMIGRPDTLVGGRGRFWLTGFERSTMGPQLSAGGVPVVPDARPEFKFFLRSDNIAFATRGVPAHTLSSYGLHTDYHKPSDDVSRIDFEHFQAGVAAVSRAVRLLADGPPPLWNRDGRPTIGP